MDNSNEFLSKFDNVNFTKTDGSKAIVGTLKEGDTTTEVRISYSMKMANSRVDMLVHEYPFQVVIQVQINGHYGATWGCTSNEDNGIFADWFSLHYYKAEQSEFKQEDKERDIASDFIKSLGI
jgi:hypothetical protein